jgi:hypothetical protein
MVAWQFVLFFSDVDNLRMARGPFLKRCLFQATVYQLSEMCRDLADLLLSH